MKILILSCGTGDGHNTAAKAIAEQCEKAGVEWELIDPISLKSEKAKNIVSGVYNKMIQKCPTAFGSIFYLGDFVDNMGVSPIYHANKSYAKQLYNYIAENKFDAVICSHLYPLNAMYYIRKKLNLNIPCYAILTDYRPHPFFTHGKKGKDLADKYFIANVDWIKKSLKQRKIPEERIYTTGIPVYEKFSLQISKEEARRSLDLPIDKKIILIMSGGMGCKYVYKICKKLKNKIDENTIVVILVGRNEQMKDKIHKNFDEKFLAFGFTDKVNLYMKSADVMISKSGGLSSTEAAVANVPLVHMKSIPGVESANSKYFAKNGMSLYSKHCNQSANHAISLLNDKNKCEQMLQNQKRIINPNSAKDILRRILENGHY